MLSNKHFNLFLFQAPNLVALTRRFNQINMWVQTEILKTSTVKARGVIMSHFVKVMKKLFDLNNLHRFENFLLISLPRKK